MKVSSVVLRTWNSAAALLTLSLILAASGRRPEPSPPNYSDPAYMRSLPRLALKSNILSSLVRRQSDSMIETVLRPYMNGTESLFTLTSLPITVMKAAHKVLPVAEYEALVRQVLERHPGALTWFQTRQQSLLSRLPLKAVVAFHEAAFARHERQYSLLVNGPMTTARKSRLENERRALITAAIDAVCDRPAYARSRLMALLSKIADQRDNFKGPFDNAGVAVSTGSCPRFDELAPEDAPLPTALKRKPVAGPPVVPDSPVDAFAMEASDAVRVERLRRRREREQEALLAYVRLTIARETKTWPARETSPIDTLVPFAVDVGERSKNGYVSAESFERVWALLFDGINRRNEMTPKVFALLVSGVFQVSAALRVDARRDVSRLSLCCSLAVVSHSRTPSRLWL